MVKVAFYKGRDRRMADKLICWWTGGEYSHCEVITRESNGISLCFSSSFMDKGIREKWMVLSPELWDIQTIDYAPELVEQWFETRLGMKYSMLGVLAFIFKRGNYDNAKYFCSDAVAYSIGIEEGWRFDPSTLKVVVDRIASNKQGNNNG
jgi:hypothetical protein